MYQKQIDELIKLAKNSGYNQALIDLVNLDKIKAAEVKSLMRL